MKTLTGKMTIDDLKLETGEEFLINDTVYKYVGIREEKGRQYHEIYWNKATHYPTLLIEVYPTT